MKADNRPADSGTTAMRCIICGHDKLLEIAGFERLPRVTSDNRPWPAGGRLCACPACNTAQKPTDELWREEASRIYSDYALYDETGGIEQSVFDQSNGTSAPRTVRILDFLEDRFTPSHAGRLLDVGCSRGTLLKAFHELRPDWELFGVEISERNASLARALPGVVTIDDAGPERLPGQFDIITMVHVLEHMTDPGDMLRSCAQKISGDGILVIEVPNYVANPVDLVVTDHCTHFQVSTLIDLLQHTGFDVLFSGEGVIPKEITIVARLAGKRARGPARSARRQKDPNVRECVAWLAAFSDAALDAAGRKPFGLFGTGLVGVWLFGQLGPAVEFFVDEDRSRVGTRFDGRPIIAPDEIPDGATVVIATAPEIAPAIVTRIARKGISYVVPPRIRAGQSHEALT